MRYSIMVREYQRDQEYELCQCDSNPEMLVAAAQEKIRMVEAANKRGRRAVPKYEHVYFKENQ